MAGGPVETSIFAVQGVEVDATSTDASSAKNQALMDVQVKAFFQLVERLGSAELAAQLKEKLKPEDIARQAGSGTRKLPWYEDEGTVADNMVLDETSWRDHIWGPNYYRTEMPELIVGNWSFSKVLIPRAVAVKMADDMDQIKSAARELGLDVVDETGSSYMSEVD
jgi:hypothetical protein